MKKVAAFLLLAVLIFSFYACTEKKSEQDVPMGMFEHMENWVGRLGKNQLTEDGDLYGIRILAEEMDTYIGTYSAECTDVTGRDVVFGGASTQARELVLSGTICADEGEAVIRIRRNDEVKELEPEEDGRFEMDLELESGGNYIMVDYDAFSGTVELNCSGAVYEEDR